MQILNFHLATGEPVNLWKTHIELHKACIDHFMASMIIISSVFSCVNAKFTDCQKQPVLF